MKTLPSVRQFGPLVLVFGVLFGLRLSAQTALLNDNFADANRSNQSLPGSAQWYGNGIISVSAGGIAVSPPQNLVANFTGGTGASQSLGVGDAITLSFTFSVTGAIDSDHTGFVRGFRVGLLNSNGSVFKDTIIYDASYNGFTGYLGALNLATTSLANSAPIALIKRSATDGSVPFAPSPATAGTSFLVLNNAFTELGGNGTSSNPYSTLGIGGSIAIANQITDGTTYVGTLTLLRDATGSMTLTLGVTGGTLSGYFATVSDTSSPFTAFNSIAIGPTSGDVTTFTLQSASVIYTAVPETSTGVMLFGLAALGFAGLRRNATSRRHRPCSGR